VNIEEAIFLRYSCRRFARREIEPEKIDELLWAGQGESQRGKRTAPSAGGIYPVGLCTIKNVNLCRVKAPLAIVLTAKFNDMRRRYGNRAERYVYIEAGHIAQNICLQAVSLGLASVCVGAFRGRDIKKYLPALQEHPIYAVLIGYARV
jgi:nitroreductase